MKNFISINNFTKLFNQYGLSFEQDGFRNKIKALFSLFIQDLPALELINQF